jgi:nucleotide-binding universal stress UspA family protein
MSDVRDAAVIVVGYDGSDAARRGLARVERLAVDRTTVVVVSVRTDLRSSGLGEPLGGQADDPHALLDEAHELLGARPGLVVDTREAEGDPAVVLVDVARELGAEIVIVGRTGSDFVARTLLGSVAERVVQRAPCDVLVVA